MSPRKPEINEKMREDTLAKISVSALKVFAEYGYHGTTMRMIAAETGLSYGLVYHYYKSKDEVFRFLIDSAIDASVFGMKAMLALPGRAWQRIEGLTVFLVEETVRKDASPYFLLILQGLTQSRSIPGLREHVSKRITEYYGALAECIREAQKDGDVADGDPIILGATYFGFLQGLALLATQSGGIGASIDAEPLLRVLRKGNRP